MSYIKTRNMIKKCKGKLQLPQEKGEINNQKAGLVESLVSAVENQQDNNKIEKPAMNSTGKVPGSIDIEEADIKAAVYCSELQDIFSGKVYCQRHNLFKEGAKKRDVLNHMSIVGCLSEKQDDILRKHLLERFCKEPKFFDYTFKVLRPETIALMYGIKHNIDRIEANKALEDIHNDESNSEDEELDAQPSVAAMVKHHMCKNEKIVKSLDSQTDFCVEESQCQSLRNEEIESDANVKDGQMDASIENNKEEIKTNEMKLQVVEEITDAPSIENLNDSKNISEKTQGKNNNDNTDEVTNMKQKDVEYADKLSSLVRKGNVDDSLKVFKSWLSSKKCLKADNKPRIKTRTSCPFCSEE